MSQFSPQEQAVISQMAALIGAPFAYAAEVYRKGRDHYIPPGWTPAGSGYVTQLLAGRKQRTPAKRRGQEAKAKQ